MLYRLEISVNKQLMNEIDKIRFKRKISRWQFLKEAIQAKIELEKEVNKNVTTSTTRNNN